MASIGEDLRTFVLASTDVSADVGSRMHQNVVPQAQQQTLPRIWYRRGGKADDLDLDGTKGQLIATTFDVECIAASVDAAMDLADVVHDRLHGYRGSFGGRTVKGCFIDDQDDDYEPKGIGSDDGLTVAALSLRIFHTT